MNYLERIRPSEDDSREGVIEIKHVVPGPCHYDVMLHKNAKRESNMPLIPMPGTFIGGLNKTAMIPESNGDESTVFDLGTIQISSSKPKESTQ